MTVIPSNLSPYLMDLTVLNTLTMVPQVLEASEAIRLAMTEDAIMLLYYQGERLSAHHSCSGCCFEPLTLLVWSWRASFTFSKAGSSFSKIAYPTITNTSLAQQRL